MNVTLPHFLMMVGEVPLPKVSKELSAIEVRRLTDGLHAVGGVAGLYLQVKGVARSWILRVVINGARRDIGLGAYLGVTLSVARQKAADLQEEIRQGVDPLSRRKAEVAERVAEQKRGILFAAVVEQFIPVKQLELAPGKYRDQWRDSLEKYARPELGKMLELADVLRVLEPIWADKTVTADKLRRKRYEILDYATVKGFRSGPNPARWEGNLGMVLPSPSAAGGEDNYPALQLKDLTRFWSALAPRGGMGAMGLRFQMLTATRTEAVRFMTWVEVDLDTRLWTVQLGRVSSKIGRNDAPKRVPLSSAAVELLRGVRTAKRGRSSSSSRPTEAPCRTPPSAR